MFVGDVHGDTGATIKAIKHARDNNVDVIIQVGDFAYDFDPKFIWKVNREAKYAEIPFLWVDGNHECGSAAMRAVTKQGFKTYEQLTLNDEVMSVDDDGNTIWQPVQEIIIKDYVGPLHSLSAKGVLGEFTPGHRIVYRRYHDSKWREDKAKNFKPTASKNIVTSGLNNKTDYPMSDDLIKLYAWCLTDAYLWDNGNWHFYQSSDKAYRIRDILDSLSLNYGETTRTRTDITEIAGKTFKNPPKPETTVRMRVAEARELPWDTNKCLADFVWKLSTRQVDILLSEMIFTDGSKAVHANFNTGVLYCVTPQIEDDLQILLCMNGYRTSKYEPRPDDRRLNLCKRSTTTLTKDTYYTTKDYDGKVWCVSVPNGRFFIELNGSIHLTGNCFDKLHKYPLDIDGTRPISDYIIHLPRNLRWEWKGVSFLALGGAFSIDKYNRIPGKEWWPEETITMQEAEIACAGGHADVMITHDIPERFMIASLTKTDMLWPKDMVRSSNLHRSLLQSIVDEVRPDRLIGGHYHTRQHGLLHGNDYTTIIDILDMNGSPVATHNTMILDMP